MDNLKSDNAYYYYNRSKKYNTKNGAKSCSYILKIKRPNIIDDNEKKIRQQLKNELYKLKDINRKCYRLEQEQKKILLEEIRRINNMINDFTNKAILR